MTNRRRLSSSDECRRRFSVLRPIECLFPSDAIAKLRTLIQQRCRSQRAGPDVLPSFPGTCAGGVIFSAWSPIQSVILNRWRRSICSLFFRDSPKTGFFSRVFSRQSFAVSPCVRTNRTSAASTASSSSPGREDDLACFCCFAVPRRPVFQKQEALLWTRRAG